MARAKELFGDYAALKGNVPGPMLATASPDKVKDYVKELIEECSEGGGLLVDGGVSGIPDEAKPENVKAMVDAVKEFGEYS